MRGMYSYAQNVFVCVCAGAGGGLKINAVRERERIHVDLCEPAPVTLSSRSWISHLVPLLLSGWEVPVMDSMERTGWGTSDGWKSSWQLTEGGRKCSHTPRGWVSEVGWERMGEDRCKDQLQYITQKWYELWLSSFCDKIPKFEMNVSSLSLARVFTKHLVGVFRFSFQHVLFHYLRKKFLSTTDTKEAEQPAATAKHFSIHIHLNLHRPWIYTNEVYLWSDKRSRHQSRHTSLGPWSIFLPAKLTSLQCLSPPSVSLLQSLAAC